MLTCGYIYEYFTAYWTNEFMKKLQTKDNVNLWKHLYIPFPAKSLCSSWCCHNNDAEHRQSVAYEGVEG